MTPTEKGRICAKCEKQVFDFQNAKWSEIVKTHQSSATKVCGYYSYEQYQNWGREIPKWYEPVIKYAVSLGIVKFLISNGH